MWATEEYAIIAFKSLCWRQIKAVKTLPHTLIDEIIVENMKDFINIIIRKIPIPPNFKRTAAKIIEPPKGASTWAFGNHKWKKNIGNFTKKAEIIKNHQIFEICIEEKNPINLVLALVIKKIIKINNGREAKIV